jgi:hypothetical protein
MATNRVPSIFKNNYCCVSGFYSQRSHPSEIRYSVTISSHWITALYFFSKTVEKLTQIYIWRDSVRHNLYPVHQFLRINAVSLIISVLLFFVLWQPTEMYDSRMVWQDLRLAQFLYAFRHHIFVIKVIMAKKQPDSDLLKPWSMPSLRRPKNSKIEIYIYYYWRKHWKINMKVVWMKALLVYKKDCEAKVNSVCAIDLFK